MLSVHNMVTLVSFIRCVLLVICLNICDSELNCVNSVHNMVTLVSFIRCVLLVICLNICVCLCMCMDANKYGLL